jgi:hypothetical protein
MTLMEMNALIDVATSRHFPMLAGEKERRLAGEGTGAGVLTIQATTK